jgi:hypothetical protein
MVNLKAFFLFSIALCLALPSYVEASTDKVAKVIIMRGNVQAKVKGEDKSFKIKKGQWLKEGTVLKTAKKSFAKLLFADKSQMSLGPNSSMAITEFPKKKAGIITLLKGQIRSKVTKDYMDMKDKNKSKLFIKTKTAAMGVRGTDFQTNYNPKNGATMLITFSGAVAMAKIDKAFAKAGKINQKALEAVVSGKGAVMVTKGRFSAATPKVEKVTLPVKINPAQFETLKESTDKPTLVDPPQAKAKPKKKKIFRSVVPPGVDSKDFANTGSEMDKTMTQTIGAAAVKTVEVELKADVHAAGIEVAPPPPPEGMYDAATKTFAPPAGGPVDLENVVYVPPPPGSNFDPVSETYIAPPQYGSFDPATGVYVNDFYDLTADGKFVEKAPEPIETTVATSSNPDGPAAEDDPNAPPPEDGERAPASSEGDLVGGDLPPPEEGALPGDEALPPPGDAPPPEDGTYAGSEPLPPPPEAINFDNPESMIITEPTMTYAFDPNQPYIGPAPTDDPNALPPPEEFECGSICDVVSSEIEQTYDTNIQQVPIGVTRARFNIGVGD